MNADQTTITTAAEPLIVRGWYGRTGPRPMDIYCTNSGWREAVWRRDASGSWYEESATMRNVIGYTQDAMGMPTPIFGEPKSHRIGGDV